MGVWVQVVCTNLVCMLCMTVGIMYAWPSSTLRLFESENTTLHRPMTEAELALFGSLSSIGALISTPTAGYLLDRLGRKYSCILTGLITVLSWTMIAASNQVEVVLTAIFLSGLSGSALITVSVYVSEFCQESIRGAMTSTTIIFYGLGMLVSYLLGGYLEYNIMVYVCLTLAVIGTVVVYGLKESPVLLMTNGLEDEAAASIAFYRHIDIHSKEVQEEMNNIRRALNPEMDDFTPDVEMKLKPNSEIPQKLSTWKFIKKSKTTRRAFALSIVCMTAAVFQGVAVVQAYAEPLFAEASPSLPSTICSVVFATVGVISGLVGAYLVELWGRRPLMIYGSLAAGLCCVVIGVQLQLHWAPDWLTALVIYLFCIISTCSGYTVPFVLMAELFLPEIKGVLSVVVAEWMWFCSFVVLFIFTPLLKAVGLSPIFYMFASFSFLCGVYCYFYQPETKGLTIDAIQQGFIKKRHRTERNAF